MPCRFRYRKCAVATSLAIAFVLSIFSSLDCIFIQVDIGFSPKNMQHDTSKKTTFGLGIWTLEDATNEGFCIVPIFRNSDTGLTQDDDIYNSFLVVSDISFTCVRFLAVFGMILGLIHVVSSDSDSDSDSASDSCTPHRNMHPENCSSNRISSTLLDACMVVSVFLIQK